ncbi:MAG: hypothetical protein ACREBG_10750 [Pyrinomonadaceae bacterium]
MQKLTDDELIHALSSDTVAGIARRFCMNERSLRRRVDRLSARFAIPRLTRDPDATVSAKTYVITSAVNATKAHAGFMRTLKLYCDTQDAQLIVIPIRYRNPTRTDDTPDDWWDARLSEYITHERTQIAPGLVVLADIKVQPTAINPLQGWLTVSGTASAILGHTKIALKAVATTPGHPAKIVQTTGACTVEQYSDTNAGKKGQFHHTLGAVVVEVDGDINHTRHICPMKDGSFIDLDKKYTVKGITDAPRVDTLTMGDIHAQRHDPSVLAATQAMAGRVNPVRIVAHDVLDFWSASHHNKYFEKFRRQCEGTSSVLRELEETAQYMDKITPLADQVVMVGSNHHDHFTQWLEKSEHAHDMENALVYHETKAAMLRAIHDGGYCDPFKLWMDKLMASAARLKWLKPGESFMRHGIEFAWHGHKAPGGARGSTKAFANIGAKIVKGHSHCAEIIDGAHSVGTSSLMDMGYNLDSPSAWTHTHDITYANGKRTLIHCNGGKFYR